MSNKRKVPGAPRPAMLAGVDLDAGTPAAERIVAAAIEDDQPWLAALATEAAAGPDAAAVIVLLGRAHAIMAVRVAMSQTAQAN